MKRFAIVGLFALSVLVPARVEASARRLSRYEYNCTIRDLLGVDFRAANDFPADNFSYGFDNNADTLTVTPALLAKYLAAAKKIARAAIEPIPAPGQPELARHANTSAQADITWERTFTWQGDYDLHIGIAGGRDPFELYLSADDGEPRRLAVSGDFEGRRYADIRTNLDAGVHRLRVFAVPDAAGALKPPYPEFIEARGPFGPVLPAIPAGYGLVFPCGHAPGHHATACVRGNLRELAKRAWRRPVTPAEFDGLMRLVTQESDLTHRMETGIEAILVSPAFLYRVETRPGNDFELASRLSYFLWSSMPDAGLFRAAEQGQLSDPAVLEAQARRMLADPKSSALAGNFAAQWLEFRNLDFIHRDPARFPEFTPELRDAMRRETELFFENVIREDRSVIDLLNAKYTFVNEILAKLYGIAGVTGDRFRKVDLAGAKRAGILTQASILTVTSYPTRTSPVLRGKWILENILNDPPAPPPANVAALRDSSAEPALTLRQQLEQHRASAACSGCHSRMDTLGFGLENFDAIGRWRVDDEALPVNSSGTLPDGSSFSGAMELEATLAGRPGDFAGCLTEKLLTFALGRGLGPADHTVAKEITESGRKTGYRFSDLVLGIVSSQTFRTPGNAHE
jgi:hypothetical protein